MTSALDHLLMAMDTDMVPCPRCKSECQPADLVYEASWDKPQVKDAVNEDGTPRYKAPYLSEEEQEQDHWLRGITTGDVSDGRQVEHVDGVCLACSKELRGVSALEYTASGEEIPPEWEQEFQEQRTRMRRRWRKA
jgi:hypothetical protein